jgi:hypothetical protein
VHGPLRRSSDPLRRLPAHRNGRLGLDQPRTTDDVGTTWSANRTRRPLAGASLRSIALAGSRVRQARTKPEGRTADFVCRNQQARSASDSFTARAEMAYSIPGCKPRIRLCGTRRSHFSRAKFIPKLSYDRRKIVAQNPAIRPELFKNRKWKVTCSTSCSEQPQ